MKQYKAEVKRVIDGDTIEVVLDMGFGISYTAKLRFLDFDAPETFRPSCSEEKEAGQKAKYYLSERLMGRRNIIVKTFKDKKGKYGRILARIFVDNEDIIETMKEMGMEKLQEWKK